MIIYTILSLLSSISLSLFSYLSLPQHAHTHTHTKYTVCFLKFSQRSSKATVALSHLIRQIPNELVTEVYPYFPIRNISFWPR